MSFSHGELGQRDATMKKWLTLYSLSCCLMLIHCSLLLLMQIQMLIICSLLLLVYILQMLILFSSSDAVYLLVADILTARYEYSFLGTERVYINTPLSLCFCSSWFFFSHLDCIYFMLCCVISFLFVNHPNFIIIPLYIYTCHADSECGNVQTVFIL